MRLPGVVVVCMPRCTCLGIIFQHIPLSLLWPVLQGHSMDHNTHITAFQLAD
ncbi:hypothetical protein K474DRAFT_265009 [Panus rudis PR-1116 ss-1]|nr:hypothetical protein K474DRAFT_265009 [Panus rudis PR-1116 ss-1]